VIDIKPDGGHFEFCQYGGPMRRPPWRPSKNVNRIAFATSGQNLVLLEESEPSIHFNALTP